MVHVGVTGHRILTDLGRLEAGLDEVLDRLARTSTGGWTVVSSLAEGADRLIARALLEQAGTRLVVVLPLTPDDYEQDFPTETSRSEFRELLSRAHEVVEVPPQGDRDRAYEAAGATVLDLSDVLVAVWDGRDAQGLGGTGGIVAEARERGMPVAWLHAGNRKPDTEEATSLGAEQGKVTFERFRATVRTAADGPSVGVRTGVETVRAVLRDKFPGADPDALELMRERGVVRAHAAQDVVCRQGETEDQYAVVISGELEVLMSHESRRTSISKVPAGSSLGGLEYFTGTPRVADVVANEPVTALELSFTDLDEVVEADPEILREISREVIASLLTSQDTFMRLLGAAQGPGQELEVFVSYARTDVDFAKKLAMGLRRFGVAAWLDVHSIRAGLSWARQVGEALDRCPVMLLVVSPASMSSDNADDEWNYFLDKNRPVIPVLYQHTDRPYRINKLQYVDFTSQPFSAALVQLVAAIRNATSDAGPGE